MMTRREALLRLLATSALVSGAGLLVDDEPVFHTGGPVDPDLEMSPELAAKLIRCQCYVIGEQQRQAILMAQSAITPEEKIANARALAEHTIEVARTVVKLLE